LSNFVRNGFVPQGYNNFTSDNEPFVLDSNKRALEKAKQNRIAIKSRLAAASGDGFSAGIDAPVAEDPAMNEAVLNDAMYMAKQLREDATNKAMKIVADANAEAEAIREQAKQMGFEEGLKEGKMEAAKRTDEYLANITRERDEIIAAERQKLEEELADDERQMVDISASLIEKLTGILVDDYKPVMMHMINSAISEEDSSKKFVIRVSEDNYGYISDNKDRISGATNPNIEIELYGDAKLGVRQCIIETDNGIIDLSMDVQVKNLVTAMKLLSES
jgi:flagellar assembly protein FliH